MITQNDIKEAISSLGWCAETDLERSLLHYLEANADDIEDALNWKLDDVADGLIKEDTHTFKERQI